MKKNLLKKLWAWVSKLWDNVDAKTKRFAPVAIKAVEALKVVMDSPVDDILAFIVSSAIKGQADDVIIEKAQKSIEEWLPKVLFELRLINSIAGLVNPEEQLRAILANLKLASDETKDMVYHGLAVLLIEKLADGKLTKSECIVIAEYYFKNREALGA